MNTIIKNLTPHQLNFCTPEGVELFVIEPEATPARVSVTKSQIGTISGLPVNTTVFGEVENLPEPQEGTIYVVSSIVAQRCTHRKDVYIVDSTIRNEKGQIIGASALGQL